ncbi:type VI secretion system baseplate subunit TssE [Enterobacteriaceae bacterium LUAb1]
MEKKKQFLPCLFERLLDDEPKKQVEAYDSYHYSSAKMRALIQQNIMEILNNINIEDTLNVVRHPYVAQSVMNYGVSPLVGKHSTPHNWNMMELHIRQALIRFEPRLIADSLLVIPSGGKKSVMHNGVIQFEIRSLIYWHPQPLDLCVTTKYDTETESATIISKN